MGDEGDDGGKDDDGEGEVSLSGWSVVDGSAGSRAGGGAANDEDDADAAGGDRRLGFGDRRVRLG